MAGMNEFEKLLGLGECIKNPFAMPEWNNFILVTMNNQGLILYIGCPMNISEAVPRKNGCFSNGTICGNERSLQN